jgi:hypothetical protein
MVSAIDVSDPPHSGRHSRKRNKFTGSKGWPQKAGTTAANPVNLYLTY